MTDNKQAYMIIIHLLFSWLTGQYLSWLHLGQMVNRCLLGETNSTKNIDLDSKPGCLQCSSLTTAPLEWPGTIFQEILSINPWNERRIFHCLVQNESMRKPKWLNHTNVYHKVSVSFHFYILSLQSVCIYHNINIT